MGPAVLMWLVLACCVPVVAAGPQDHVLRFLSQEDIARMAKETKEPTDDIIIVSDNKYKGQPLEKFRAKSTVCPNEVTECPETTTCCPLRNGQYGCCDGVSAVCCKGGVHCCPEGFKCDEEHSQCVSAALGLSFHWEDKKVVRSRPVVSNAANVTCRDKTVCKANDTCCNATVGFGCCPLSHAVCCRDKAHCCPAGTQCDLVHKRCFRQDQDWEQPWVEKRLMEPKPGTEVGGASARGAPRTGSVICRDGQMCPDGSTCCQMIDGSYGCCPYTDAGAGAVSSMAKSVICPGGSSECPDGSTCCQLASGDWGCCPKTNAVCCSDHIHCCPEHYTCDLTAGSCNPPSGQVSLPWETKKPARPRVASSVVCPGGRSQCPQNQTCCPSTSGAYVCCPDPNATCCSDHLHCCPHGYKCNMVAKTCDPELQSVSLMKKVQSSHRVASNVVCPGGKSQCPQNQTCCQAASGSYVCCIYANATCCSDHLHCCPHGYKCNMVAKTCDPELQSVSLMEKVQASHRVASNVVCPGGRSQCPQNQTCCPSTSGAYVCCPDPNATCCSDHLHCCPHGYKCNMVAKTCDPELQSVSLMEKVQASPRVASSVVCPGGRSQCPQNQTCCPSTSGAYVCCPDPNATCCSDHLHCCPHGYKCNMVAKTCDPELQSVSLMEKVQASPRSSVEAVVCPGGRVQCADGQTCCKLPSGEYGCCPFPQAVCCTDHTHCCPSGFTCDLSAQTCRQGTVSLPWIAKQPASPRADKVVCPDKSACADGQTCCKLASGEYGCCPKPNAVCCSDHLHCCPEGYTCDTSVGRCNKGPLSLPWDLKQPARPRADKVICPDQKSECSDGQTCCQMSSGEYGCCPKPNAVCCSDHQHCCPQGYTCDTSEGRCNKGPFSLPWDLKQQARPRADTVICPDQKSECSDGQTCCQMSSGGYGCCPKPNAVCCSDHQHCCPQGYTCDTSEGRCNKGPFSLPWDLKQPARPSLH